MTELDKAVATSNQTLAQKQSDAAAHATGMGLDLTTGKPITPATVRGNVINPNAVSPGSSDPSYEGASRQPGTTNRTINSKDTR